MARKAKTMRLTDSERQFIEDNHGLLLKFMHQHNIDIEQYYGPLAEKFCRCLRNYDESRGAFSTYLWRALSTEYWSIRRTEFASSRYIPPECFVYLDQVISYENNVTEGELIGYDELAYSNIETQELIRSFKSYLHKNCKQERSRVKLEETFDLLLEGKTQVQISEYQGISKQAVSRRVETLRQIYDKVRGNVYAGC